MYGYPIWFKLYSARQAFGMDALRPQDWDDLVERMTNDPKLFDLFYKYDLYRSQKLITVLSCGFISYDIYILGIITKQVL